MTVEIDGRFWLLKESQPFLGTGRVELLERIDKLGSIHAAAKEMKMSYKAAWDRIDAMNRLAGKPLLERTVGGKGGGGTVLTDHAKAMIRHYRRLEELHRQFLDRFAAHADDPDELARLLGRLFVTTSARNQLSGTVQSVTAGSVNAEVVLTLKGGETIISIITAKAARDLALAPGCDAYAIVKSNDVIFAADHPGPLSAQNIIRGTVRSCERGAVNTEIVLALEGGATITGVITNDASDEIGLAVGGGAYAVISASQVIIGI